MTTLAGPEQQLASLEGAHVLFRGLWGQFDAFMLLMETCAVPDCLSPHLCCVILDKALYLSVPQFLSL